MQAVKLLMQVRGGADALRDMLLAPDSVPNPLPQDYGWYVGTAGMLGYLAYRIIKTSGNPLPSDSSGAFETRDDRRFRAERFAGEPGDGKRPSTERRGNLRRRRARGAAGDRASSSGAVLPSGADSANFDIEGFLADITSGMPASPSFLADVFESAMQIALLKQQPLLLYLHAPSSAESESFLSRVLGHQVIVDYLKSNMVCWAGSLRDSRGSQGFAVARNLRLSDVGRPWVVVVGVAADSRRGGFKLRVAASKLAGEFRAPGEMLQWLVGATDGYRAGELQRAESASRSRIINEQNSEYDNALARDEAALRQDKILEERKRAEEKAKREAERAKEAERKRREAAQKVLPPEPAAGPGVALIRFRFPDGSTQIDRRFRTQDSFSSLLRFVNAQQVLDREGNIVPPEKIKIVNPALRKKLSGPDSTLEALGITRRCVLCVEEASTA